MLTIRINKTPLAMFLVYILAVACFSAVGFLRLFYKMSDYEMGWLYFVPYIVLIALVIGFSIKRYDDYRFDRHNFLAKRLYFCYKFVCFTDYLAVIFIFILIKVPFSIFNRRENILLYFSSVLYIIFYTFISKWCEYRLRLGVKRLLAED